MRALSPAAGRWLLAAAVTVLASGCPEPGVTLTVRIQTGLRAEHEVRYVEVAYVSGARACSEVDAAAEGREIVESDQAALVDGSFTVREITDLAPGVYTVRARVRRPPPDAGGDPEDGATLLTRCVTVSITGSRVLRIPLTSDCVNVECPAPAGSAAFSECLAGRCVDPRCDPDDPSTAELCCDRALLGDACDDDPTLCRSSDDCEPTLACAGTPSCEARVCVEPVEDACEDDAYCSVETSTCLPVSGARGDAGVPDAAMPIDVYVPPGVDASFPDAFEDDAAMPVDAHVPPGVDANVPDAYEEPDAYVGPDAPFSGAEDCSLEGDEDGLGGADCADPACFTHPFCVHPDCPPYSPRVPPTAAIPTPTHWYRGDYGRITGLRTDVCGWRDIVGGAHLFRDDLFVYATSLGSQPAVGFGDRRRLVIDDDDLGLSQRGDFSVFIVAQRAGAMGTMTVLRSWLPGVTHEVFTTSHAAGSGSFGVVVRGNTYALGDVPSSDPLRESFVVGSLVRASSIAGQIEYRRQGIVVPLMLQSGTDMTGSSSIAAVPQLVLGGEGEVIIAEILLYDHAVTPAERAMIEAYLEARYEGASS
ncbi:MAG: hypothetical protein J0L92_15685 [Deltaproteobacteria bacterium]|nr:hypothetical protein [Deltaproteobacteria bacterium]